MIKARVAPSVFNAAFRTIGRLLDRIEGRRLDHERWRVVGL